jgi:hypothetical protein
VAACRGVRFLLDQYSPIKAALERVNIFRDELAAMDVAPIARQIALTRCLFIAKD